MNFVDGFVGFYNSKGFGEAVAVMLAVAAYFGGAFGLIYWVVEGRKKP